MTSGPEHTVSVIVPTYRREGILVDTLDAIAAQLQPGDEILVVDQTPTHEPETEARLRSLAAHGTIRWYRKTRPSQCEAMNAAAHLARGRYVFFIDDDIVPDPGLVDAHRTAHARDATLSATSGQVLQPWNPEPVRAVPDFALGFDSAFDQPCDILSLMAGNFCMQRETFLAIGGMDENFRGNNYRNDAELAYRIHARTGRKVRFLPQATMRHLLAGGGNRAFGTKDSWGGIGGSIGDYYFAAKSLPLGTAVTHTLRRLLRAPVNRFTVRRPWLIPSLQLRELVALVVGLHRWRFQSHNRAKELSAYTDLREA